MRLSPPARLAAPDPSATDIDATAPLTADEIRWDSTPASWPDAGHLLTTTVSLLPKITNPLAAALVEDLALALCDARERVAAVQEVESATLSLLHDRDAEIARLRRRLAETRNELRESRRSPTRTHAGTDTGKKASTQESKQGNKQKGRYGTTGREGIDHVDMREKLSGLLSLADVENMGGVYVGEVAEVVEEDVRSPGTGKTTREAVIEFTDGTRYVPSNTATRTLIKMFGYESDNWPGKEIEINLRERRGQLEKFVVEPDATDAPRVRDGSEKEGSTPSPTTSETDTDAADDFRA